MVKEYVDLSRVLTPGIGNSRSPNIIIEEFQNHITMIDQTHVFLIAFIVEHMSTVPITFFLTELELMKCRLKNL